MIFNKKEKVYEKGDIDASNIIGKGTTVEGNTHTTGNMRIEGSIKGNITTKAKLVLGNTAHVEGNVEAQNCEVAGKLHGNSQVEALLTLKATAVVVGNILAGKLVLEEGARFNGKCEMIHHKPAEGTANTLPGRVLKGLEEKK
jgi:cytoskeletal protein CcmA (bactofilin family)